MSKLASLAAALDEAIDAFESAAYAYVEEALRLNADYQTHNNRPHPFHERAPDFVRTAIGSKPKLGNMLGVSPINPPRKVAANHPD